MSKRRGKVKTEQKAAKPELQNLPILNLDAAAVDIGQEQHCVAVPPGRDGVGSEFWSLHR